MMTLGEKVRALMDEKGMDVTRLSEASGLPRGTITNLLWRDDTTIFNKTAEKLAAALGVDPKELQIKPLRRKRDTGLPKKNQLCWSCRNAVPDEKHGCSWSRHLDPVVGWTATQTETGYRVTACPQYRKEKTDDRNGQKP